MSSDSSNTPEWVKELRSGWMEEIQSMPEDVRKQYETPNRHFSTRVSLPEDPKETHAFISVARLQPTPDTPESAPTLAMFDRSVESPHVHSAPHMRRSSFGGESTVFDSPVSSPRNVADASDVTGSPVSRPILRTTSMLFAAKPKVEKALQTLRAFQIDCDANLVATRTEERRFRAFVQSDLTQFHRWSNPVLIALCRKYANLRLHLLALQQAYFAARLLVVKHTYSLARRCIDEGAPIDDSADFLKGPKRVLSRSAHVMFLERHCNITEVQVAAAHTSYMAARKSSRPLTRAEWKRRMKQVLNEAQPDPLVAGTPYCLPDEHLQKRFDALVTDERTPEGSRFWQFYDRITLESSWVAQHVVEFIEDLARDIALFVEQPDGLDLIMLFVSRVVFTRGAQVLLHRHAAEGDSDKDRIYAENMARLHDQPQQHFGVEHPVCVPAVHVSYTRQFLGPDNTAYGRAIEALSELTYVVVPSDALYCVMRATKLMYLQAKEYSGGQTALGADYLFPIFVWCTLRAKVPKLVSLVTFIRTFANANETASETGYYLTTLEAAVEHVCRLTPERFAAHIPRDVESSTDTVDETVA